jgi:outer membrane protein OmpA-like peptidoglycan-associated protein
LQYFSRVMGRRSLLFLYCVLGCLCVDAQVSKLAEARYNAAMRLKAARLSDKACKKMAKAINNSPAYRDAYSELGQWYFQDHKYTEAADVFRQAVMNCPNGKTAFAKPLVKSLLYAGKPDEALSYISANNNSTDAKEWGKMREQAWTIKQALAQPWYTPEDLTVRVNSPYAELFPSMTVDEQTLYFTRRVNNMDEDFYIAHADSCGGWFSGRNMGDPPNTPDQESSQFISADGHYLFITRCENRSVNEWTDGGCDLFMAYRTSVNATWTTPQPFGGTINTPGYEGMPSLSPDNRELFFVSDRPGGLGGYDIWISRFENGLWQAPVNAGPSINTAGNETAPHIDIDNKTLYFTSDGWPGLGGSDLFISRRQKESDWEKATNLGYPINTAHEEKSTFVSFDGEQLYFASDRNGPPNNYDLFKTQLPAQFRPQPVSYLQGYIYDSLTQERLSNAVLFICSAHTGDTLYRFLSNRGDASYLVTLPSGYKYAIHTSHVGNLPVSDTVFFDKQYLKEPLTKNVAMLPWNYEDIKPIADTLVATLHFDVNKTELSAADKKTINDALASWHEVKGIVIYINAYTDNTGTPMINEELSTKRANTVSQEISSLGFNEMMLQPKGWGEAKPVADNETEEGRMRIGEWR